MVNSSKTVPSKESNPKDPAVGSNQEALGDGNENHMQQRQNASDEQGARVAAYLESHEIELARLRQDAKELNRAKQKLVEQAAAQ